MRKTNNTSDLTGKTIKTNRFKKYKVCKLEKITANYVWLQNKMTS